MQLPRVRGQTPGLPRRASACDGGSRARPGGARHRGEHGGRSFSIRAAAAVATDGTQRGFRRRRRAVSARRPATSAAAQQQQRERERADDRQSRHRRQVRDDRDCTAAALGLPPPSRAAPAAMSTVTVPEAAGVIVAM